MNYRNPFYQVPKLQYSQNDFSLLLNLIPVDTKKILVIQDSKVNFDFPDNKYKIYLFKVDVSVSEPTTSQINDFTNKFKGLGFDCIIGIGGGSVLDIAKSLSITLSDKNSLPVEKYQGWDLVKHQPIYKIGIPCLYGSGSEASRTAVLSSSVKKQGINSQYSMFDAVFLTPNLDISCDKIQKFYSGMDCFIHCVESSEGNFINPLSMDFAVRALQMCKDWFLNGENEELMVLASYFGGVSIVNSEVGICHALSYGLSQEFNIRHGLANCLIFNHLESFYGDHVRVFKKMLQKNNIILPENICKSTSEDQLNRMVESTYRMERPLLNALGDNYKEILTKKKIYEIYKFI